VPYVRTIRALIADKEAEIAKLEAEQSAAGAYVRLLRKRLEAAEKRWVRRGEVFTCPRPSIFDLIELEKLR
jgi:hypothetical protein